MNVQHIQLNTKDNPPSLVNCIGTNLKSRDNDSLEDIY